MNRNITGALLTAALGIAYGALLTWGGRAMNARRKTTGVISTALFLVWLALVFSKVGDDCVEVQAGRNQTKLVCFDE